MTNPLTSPELFFENTDLTLATAKAIVQQGLEGADYGEFYHEITERESLVKNKGQYTTVSVGNGQAGFGFRVGKDERVGYAFSDVFNEASLRQAVAQARLVLKDVTPSPQMPQKSGRITDTLYPTNHPFAEMTLADKISKIDEIEAYIKTLDPRITNVTVSYGATSKAVHVLTQDGKSLADRHPLVTLALYIQLTDENGNSETGHAFIGGKTTCSEVFDEKTYQEAAAKALHMTKELLIAEEAPAGVMDVVLNQGWPAVILHEAIGHGLEGDFNRKGISVYSGKIGQRVAGDEVTVIDQGNLPNERGSLHFDDEGIPTQKNILIEKGILKAYMQDRQNAHLMQEQPTGNGRRESYVHVPMPRMTNTYFENGNHDPADIIKSVKDGLYIADMGGGQVDIVSGKFNMNAILAYRIRDGKLCEPVKGATLVGDGLSVIRSITMVGNDLKLEKSAGACGKSGQSVTVSCGQPTVRVSNMTIGGVKK